MLPNCNWFFPLVRPASRPEPSPSKSFFTQFSNLPWPKTRKRKKNAHKYLIYYYKTFSQFTRDQILKQKLKVSSLITNGPNIMLGILLDCFDLFIIFIICISIFILYWWGSSVHILIQILSMISDKFFQVIKWCKNRMNWSQMTMWNLIFPSRDVPLSKVMLTRLHPGFLELNNSHFGWISITIL